MSNVSLMVEEELSVLISNMWMPNQTMYFEEVKKNCSDYHQQRQQSDSNLTFFSEQQKNTLENVYNVLYFVLIPVVCIFGFFGNILNVIVFSKKKMCKTLDDIEHCTTMCLIALAISDMMFCLCTFPQAFDNNYTRQYRRSEFMLYYNMYSNFAISTFILSSTLLTVLTAVMRYTAICHPFHSRQCISIRKTLFATVAVFIFSAAFNSPYIWRHRLLSSCQEPNTVVMLDTGVLFNNHEFVYTHRLLWAIIGNLIPFIVLLYCNIRLVKALHESQQLRLLHSRDNVGCLSSHRRINITLITIIILFFILVAPCEISKFISYVNHTNQTVNGKYYYLLVSMVTNGLQCMNFSVNFILYYVIIVPFRKTVHEFVCGLLTRKLIKEESHSPKQTFVLLTLKEQRRSFV